MKQTQSAVPTNPSAASLGRDRREKSEISDIRRFCFAFWGLPSLAHALPCILTFRALIARVPRSFISVALIRMFILIACKLLLLVMLLSRSDRREGCEGLRTSHDEGAEI